MQLEQDIVGRVPAVMDEQVDGTDLSEERPQTSAALALDIGPAAPVGVVHGDADLMMHFGMERRRKIDAPQVTAAVARQRLLDEARGQAMADAGLHDRTRAV